ncbi:hypothetical protein [Gordonia sp. ABSL49_1]|uniref:YveK family protein n=1 Tax=Gordonia sp. ABSL49_1 TaxID=2920941 RepID=UPI001F104347|nr:hypothetical protein [Gordonia sp. ABSL49_1]MCH5645479.1 hypothetical protein [Gordonia sp. ABSL49_1]
MKALGLTVARRLPLIVVCGLIGLMVAVIVASTASTSYRATTTLFASTAAQDVSSAYQGNLAATARVKTYQVLASGPELMVRAAEKSGVGISGGDLASQLETEVPPGTVLLNVTVTDDNASDAARLSQAVADELVSEVGAAEKPLGGGKQSLGLIVLQPARAGVEEVPAFSVTNAVLFTILGLVVGIVLAIAIPSRVSLWPRRKRSDDADDADHVGGVDVIDDLADVTQGGSVGAAETFLSDGTVTPTSHRAKEWP